MNHHSRYPSASRRNQPTRSMNDDWSFDGQRHRTNRDRESSPNYGARNWGPQNYYDFNSQDHDEHMNEFHGRSSLHADPYESSDRDFGRAQRYESPSSQYNRSNTSDYGRWSNPDSRRELDSLNDRDSSRAFPRNFDQTGPRGSSRDFSSAASQSFDYGRMGTETQSGMNRDRDATHFGKGPKGYKRADARIEEEVCDALTHDHGVDASDIEVTVKDGVVTLSGSIPERRMKRLAEDCAENIPGVTDVRNELTTKSASTRDSDQTNETNLDRSKNKAKGSTSSSQNMM